MLVCECAFSDLLSAGFWGFPLSNICRLSFFTTLHALVCVLFFKCSFG
uniref:Uncharacterized protein n=1 Tax=Anguilla anguilla TaxID=7936 RepID=A0A0E9QG01_ANGAN